MSPLRHFPSLLNFLQPTMAHEMHPSLETLCWLANPSGFLHPQKTHLQIDLKGAPTQHNLWPPSPRPPPYSTPVAPTVALSPLPAKLRRIVSSIKVKRFFFSSFHCFSERRQTFSRPKPRHKYKLTHSRVKLATKGLAGHSWFATMWHDQNLQTQKKREEKKKENLLEKCILAVQLGREGGKFNLLCGKKRSTTAHNLWVS